MASLRGRFSGIRKELGFSAFGNLFILDSLELLSFNILFRLTSQSARIGKVRRGLYKVKSDLSKLEQIHAVLENVSS